MVYDEQNQFHGYDSGDVSIHGYDYESDDLPAGCHFEDDHNIVEIWAPAPTPSMAAHGPAAASQPVAPALAPAPHPHHVLCSQHPSIESNNTFTQNATLDDVTKCRGLVCYPVAASVEANGLTQSSDTTPSNVAIAAIAICRILGLLILSMLPMCLCPKKPDKKSDKEIGKQGLSELERERAIYGGIRIGVVVGAACAGGCGM